MKIKDTRWEVVIMSAVGAAIAFSIANGIGARQKLFSFAFPSGSEADVFRYLGQNYCREQNIACRFVELDYETLFRHELRELMSSSGNCAADPDDIIAIDDPWLPRLMATDCLYPLADGSDIRATDFVGRALGVAQFSDGPNKGDYAAAPILGNVQLLAVNRDRLISSESAQVCKGTTWRELIHGGKHGWPPHSAGIVLRGASRNPFLTDFMPLLRQVDERSLPETLSTSPAFTPDALAAFREFEYIIQNAPDSYASLSDFDSQALVFKNVAAFAVTWSNTAMLSRLDFAGIPGAGEKDGSPHVDHIEHCRMPGDDAEIGEWLVAIPKAGDKRRAMAFIKWLTSVRTPERTNEGAESHSNADQPPMLQAALLKGNPPTLESIYRDKDFQDAFPLLGDEIRTALSRGFYRPRDPNWDCMRNKISDSLDALASEEVNLLRRRDTKTIPNPYKYVRQLNLFIACIQQKQKAAYTKRAYVCDPSGDSDPADVQACWLNPGAYIGDAATKAPEWKYWQNE